MGFQYSVEQIETIFGKRWAIMRNNGTEFDCFETEQEAWAIVDEFHLTLTPEAKTGRAA